MTAFPGYIPPAAMTISGVPATWARGEFLAWLVGRLGWRDGVEIGVSYGETLRHLLAACPALRMLGVDTWAPNPTALEPPDWGLCHHAAAYESALQVEQDYLDRCVLIRAPSVAAAAAADMVDFAWIDGDHGTEAVLTDIAAWLPRIRPGGWLLGHDVNWPTVRAAVDVAVPGYLVGPDSVWFRPVHPAPGWWAEVVG
jgi:hypothetical protein